MVLGLWAVIGIAVVKVFLFNHNITRNKILEQPIYLFATKMYTTNAFLTALLTAFKILLIVRKFYRGIFTFEQLFMKIRMSFAKRYW